MPEEHSPHTTLYEQMQKFKPRIDTFKCLQAFS